MSMSQVKNHLHANSTLQEVDKTHQECQEIKAFTRAFLQEVAASRLPSSISEGEILFRQVPQSTVATVLQGSTVYRCHVQGVNTTAAHLLSVGRLLLTGCFLCFIPGVCGPRFMRQWGQFGEKICTQTWTWEKQLKYRTLFHFLQAKEEEIGTGVKIVALFDHIYISHA